MTDEDWEAGFARSIGVFLNGDAIPDPGPRGERIVDDSFYVLFNAHTGVRRVPPAERPARLALEPGPRHVGRAPGRDAARRGRRYRPGARPVARGGSIVVLTSPEA